MSRKRRRAAGIATAVLTYIGTLTSASNLTTYTFTAASIGAARTNRLVVLAVQGLTTTGRTISSVTIGGNAASVAASSASNNSQSGLYYLNVTSGTTADIVVTFSGSNSRCTVHVYTITGLKSFTPVGADATVSTSSTSLNRTIAISKGGCAIGVAWVGFSPSTITWTNLTKDSGVTNEVQQFSSASASGMAENAGLTITAAGSGSAGPASLAVASWR